LVVKLKILVATDLSESSDIAMHVAAQQYAGAEFALVHVMPTMGEERALFPGETEAPPESDLEDRCYKAVLASAERCGIRTPQVFLAAGVAHEAICEQAANWKADVVVVGCKPASLVTELLLGSVASRVVGSHHGPVLVVRAPIGGGPVLAAVDFSSRSQECLRTAHDEATRRGKKLITSHVIQTGMVSALDQTISSLWSEGHSEVTVAADAERLLTEMLHKLAVTAEVVVREGGVAKELALLIEQAGADLLVLGAHGRSTVRDFTLGTIASRLIRQTSCSILVTR
jgi:nucleotide-binding universal stress UspA family protein